MSVKEEPIDDNEDTNVEEIEDENQTGLKQQRMKN